MHIVALVLAALLLLPSVGFADDGPVTAKQIAKMKAKVERIGVGERARVNVVLRDNSEVKGYVATINAASFDVMPKTSAPLKTISYAEVSAIKRPGKTTAIVIGVILTAAVATVIGVYAKSHPTPTVWGSVAR
jgi:hypothetical protein